MKVILALVLFLAIAYCITIPGQDETEAKKMFDTFKRTYGKTYESPIEEMHRFRIFRYNMARYERMNKHYPTAHYGMNKFADLTKEEFSRARLSSKKISAEPLARSCLSKGVTVVHMDTSDIPTSYDWRTSGVVSGVKDQGQCGSCWAFSTIGNIESQYAIKNKNVQPIMTFSEQLLVDCSQGCSNEPPYGNVCNQGCDGGWQWNAMEDVMFWGGVETEADYPYTAQDGTCQLNKNKLHAAVKNYTCLTNNVTSGADEDVMAAFLVANGPLAVALNADLVEGYSNGVINPASGDCDGSSLDHAVLIVGYGVQSSVAGDSIPFWIVKNSWGADWGEQGYFRLVRGKAACGINEAVLMAILA